MEGAVAAAARGAGASLEEVAREACGALRMKTEQLGSEDDAAAPDERGSDGEDGGRPKSCACPWTTGWACTRGPQPAS